MSVRIIQGDCRVKLRELPAESIHCCITSPPYWGLRDYGLSPLVWRSPARSAGGGDTDCEHEWGDELPRTGKVLHGQGGSTLTGGHESWGNRDGASQGSFCLHCGAWRGSLGLEPTPDLYVEHLVEVMREVKRVLRDDGTLWLNLGDSYANTGVKDPSKVGGFIGDRIRRKHAGKNPNDSCQDSRPRTIPPGLKPKDLCGIPWRVAFALQADGWWLRSDIIWAKSNSMPESVTDRPTRAHEYVFLLSKSARYFYDADAVREATSPATLERDKYTRSYPKAEGIDRKWQGQPEGIKDCSAGRNRRTVWTIPTSPFAKAHFATFPPALVEPMIRAGTSERGVCPECGAGWVRVMERNRYPTRPGNPIKADISRNDGGRPDRIETQSTTIGWRPTCECAGDNNEVVCWHCKGRGCESCGTTGSLSEYYDPIPATCLDPFGGAGTVGLVADRLGRDAIVIDLNADYCEMSRERIQGDAPLLVNVEVT